MPEFAPDTPSSTYAAMMSDWMLIRAIRGGASVVRAAGEAYLPKFASEDQADYQRRLTHAPFSAHYEDATRALIAKPFAKEVALQGTVPEAIKGWAENIDLAGSNLHVFAQTVFAEALHMGVGYILAEYPKAEGVRTRAEEKARELRPYLRMIQADEMLAIYEGYRNGRTIIRQIRFRDNDLQLVDMEEKLVERVRRIDDEDGVITQRLYEKDEKGTWAEKEKTAFEGAAEIFIVPVIFGLERVGRYGVKPTMADLAYSQIQHYQHSNRIDEIFNFAGFPMLQAKGMSMPLEPDGIGGQRPIKLTVGPKSVLFATPGQQGDKPEWSFVEPSAQSIKEAREHLKDIEAQMRTLGLQPSMPSIGIQKPRRRPSTRRGRTRQCRPGRSALRTRLSRRSSSWRAGQRCPKPQRSTSTPTSRPRY